MTQIEDKVWRAYGSLRYGRSMTSEEVINLCSAVRLGVALSFFGLPPLNQYDAGATDLRDMFTSAPDFRPYTLQPIQFARRANDLWLAMTRGLDFSRPDRDEVRLQAAIMKSEGLPRRRTE